MQHVEGGRTKKILLVTIFFAVALALFASILMLMRVDHLAAKKTIQIGGSIVQATVADTPAKRTKGLSGTASLDANQGMLFVFPQNDRHGIWMKDMQYALDIIWLSDDKKVVDVEANISPTTYPNVFTPSEDARYVLEVPSGFTAAANIRPGVQADF